MTKEISIKEVPGTHADLERLQDDILDHLAWLIAESIRERVAAGEDMTASSICVKIPAKKVRRDV